MYVKKALSPDLVRFFADTPVVPLAECHLKQAQQLDQLCFFKAWSKDLWENELCEGNTGGIWLPDGSGSGSPSLVGLVSYSQLLDEAEITKLAVHPTYRRVGIGSRLVRWMMTQLRLDQVTAIFLEVRSSNLAAQCLYDSFGFQRVGIRANYYPGPTPEDAIVMKCILDPTTNREDTCNS